MSQVESRGFRLDKLSRPTRFRPRKGEYGKRKLRQRQPGFSILSWRLLRFRIRNQEGEERYKLNFSDKIRSEYSDIRIPKQLALSRAGVREVIESDIVMNRTGDLQATIDEINFGDLMSQVQGQCSTGDNSQLSPNGELEKGELEEAARSRGRVVKPFIVTESYRENNSKPAIKQQLLSTGSLTGAQRLQCSSLEQGRREQERLEPRRLCAMNNNDGQLSPTESTAEGGVKIDAPSRADNYLTRQRDTVINRRGQLGRWPPPVERYDSRLRADLYPHWQDIRLKMTPISEREEDCHNTVITSSKVSSLKTGVITPLSSSEILSNCSTESRDVAETSDCSTFSCMLPSSRRASKSRIVSEQSSVCDQQATQQLGNAFPETVRRSKVKNVEEGYGRDEDNRNMPKLPLYGRLQRHKKRYNRFNERMKQNSRTCMEAINCIARMSRRMQFEFAKMF